MSLRRAAISAAWLASQLPHWRRFAAAAADPRAAQAHKLQLALRDVDHAYGRAVGLAGVRSLDDLRRVPIVDYDALAPYIDRIAAGERAVITSRTVKMMERTGGASGPNKLVPYTDALRAEFACAIGAWMVDLHSTWPSLVGTRSYWSVSPVARAPERTAGGLRIGFDDDTEYFDPVSRRAIEALMAVPADVARLPDLDAWRHATWTHLLSARDLGLISVWSPTFLTALVAWLRARPELHAGPLVWPRLRVISCWTEGGAAPFVAELQALFPTVRVQTKGLLATEGVVTVPIEGVGCVPAVTSHVIELLEVGGDRVCGAHEADVGGRYSPLITTSGGLWRYHLKDVLRCTGRWRGLPVLAYEGRLDRVSDLVGEKISEANARDAIAAGGFSGAFALLAPRRPADRAPHYALFVEGTVDVARVEVALARSHHYRYARDLGQLGPVELVVVRDGRAAWERLCVARGQRLGDLKPTPLETRVVEGLR